ncbi:MAG: helix-turn-helix transcriptional regulator [Bacilli bacterium]|nr:helix-turn-helix transcriptional regulator [Bacilli bacterium]
MTKSKYKARKLLANNIVYYRLENGWSQEDFADALGTTPTYVSNLENAKRNTRIDYIDLIADTLGVPIETLFKERTPVKNHRIPRR